MGHGHDTCAVAEERAIDVKVETAGAVDRNDLYLQTFAAGEQLPRNDVGVMLHHGEDDFVALGEQ